MSPLSEPAQTLLRVTAHKNSPKRVPLKGAEICWCRKGRSFGCVVPNTSQVMTEARLLDASRHNEWRRMLFTSNRYDNCPNAHYKRVSFGSQSSSCWVIAPLSGLFVSQSLCPDLLEYACCIFCRIAPFFLFSFFVTHCQEVKPSFPPKLCNINYT